MATVEVATQVDASLADTWDHFFREPAWRTWVDGFGAVVANDGYPEKGGSLRWRATPAGRGEVSERVLEHEHRRRHLVSFADPTMEGELETRFAIAGEGTRVVQALTYQVVARGPIARIGAVLFVNGQIRASMERSLLGFREFVEGSGAAG